MEARENRQPHHRPQLDLLYRNLGIAISEFEIRQHHLSPPALIIIGITEFSSRPVAAFAVPVSTQYKQNTTIKMTTECIETITETRCEDEEPFLTIHDVPIYFNEDWDAGIGGGLWSTGLALAKYFQSSAMDVRRSLRRLSSKKLSVLELGSGNGFLALCFLALARDLIGELVVTDTGDEHLKLIQDTLEKNSHIVHDMASTTRPKLSVLEHRWGEFLDDNNDVSTINNDNDTTKNAINDENDAIKTASATSSTPTVMSSNRKFDFIFGSDLAYREELYSPLISTLENYCHGRTVFLLGITMQDTRPKFFHLLKEAGFRYERLGDHLMQPEFRGTTFGLFMIQKR